MIGKIIEFSIKNRFLVLLLTAILIAIGLWATFNIRLDAIPDLSDVQVIVVTEYPGQNPEVVDDQVTYPLAAAMLSVPGSTVVRGYSMFELSFVYVLFEDGTDIYWARSRVLEYLNFARDRLPPGVEPKLGPDATGVGWVYQYVLYPGYYCPDHPKGIWRDEKEDKWYAKVEDAPEKRREELQRVRAWEKPGECPLSRKRLESSNQDLASLRTLQDWYLRYPMTGVEGVSEIAPIGGFVKQYQVVLDPVKLQAYNLPLREVMMAIERSNNDVGGAVIEKAENELMVRSRGYLRGLDDLAQVVVMNDGKGTPVLLRDVARLEIGGEMRRGVGELDGEGEAVGGVVISRFGENAFKVIQDAKAKLFELEDGLPPGVFIKATYDRSALIDRAVATLRDTLFEEITVVALVCILFLLHARSELVAVFVVPTGVLVSILIMQLMGINANIMSLGGIAIAIGVMVDSSIVMVENSHKHLDREEERLHALQAAGQPAIPRPRTQIITEAAREVGPSLFFSLLIIVVSFLPIFVLGEQSGRLFKPLAYTKTFAMAAASLLAVTIIPVLMSYFITARVLPKQWGWRRNAAITLAAMFLPAALLLVVPLGAFEPYRYALAIGWAILLGMLLVPQKIIHENANPLSWLLQKMYHPFFILAMRLRWLTVGLAVLLVIVTWWPFSQLGSEFMPPLEEGDLLYMPTTDPSISVLKSKELLQQTDKIIKTFPEVVSVHGKIGRAETATDPAPLSMVETVVRLHTDESKWRTRKVGRFFSEWPNWLKRPFTATFWPEERTITTDELKYGWTDPDGTRHVGLNQAVSFPGMANAWPYPIENRINMLSTGIKTPVGIKIMGPDLQTLADLAERTASAVSAIEGTISSYPERTLGGYYLDITPNRAEASRYGLNVGDVQDVVRTAVGGMNVTTTVEGLERYPLNIRYARELRDDIPSLRNILVATPMGAQVPLGQLADIRITPGPPMIRSENGQRTAWIFVDIDTSKRDLGGYVAEAKRVIEAQVPMPAGYSRVWSGRFEYLEKANERLAVVVPITGALIVLLLYMATGSWLRVGIVLLAVPFSLVGAVWLLWLMDYNLSLAVWVGVIALAGLDAETGLIMLLYLDNSFERFKVEGRMRHLDDLWHAVHDGAVKRIRPKTMTVATTFIGLVPLLWATGTGADTMRRLAVPMIGGLATSFIAELLVYPVLFYVAKRWQMRAQGSM